MTRATKFLACLFDGRPESRPAQVRPPRVAPPSLAPAHWRSRCPFRLTRRRRQLSPTAGAATASPTAESSPDDQTTRMIFTAYGANDHAVAGGSIYLGSPQGLMRIDPRSNQVSIVDHDPGSALSVLRDTLWRAAWATGDVYRYDAVERSANARDQGFPSCGHLRVRRRGMGCRARSRRHRSARPADGQRSSGERSSCPPSIAVARPV